MHGSCHLSWTSFANGESLASSLLFCHLQSGLVSLLDWTTLLSTMELNVTVVSLEGRNSTVSSVGSSTACNGTLNNDVGDHALLDIKTFSLSVRDKIVEELKDGLNRLLGPSTDGSRGLEFFSLSVSTSVSDEPLEWHDLFVLNNILHVSDGLVKFKTLAGTGSLVSVLEMTSKIGDSSLGSYKETIRHQSCTTSHNIEN